MAHILSAVLQTAGLKIGIYTSPHLLDYRERIRINNNKVNKDYVTSLVYEYRDQMEKTGASFFELSVAMAFDYFLLNDVDYAIIETGLGGRLDSTNIIKKPNLSIITNIGLDHQFYLGNTYEEIAFEKAGIIKEKCTVVVGEFLPQSSLVFENIAKKKNAKLIKAYEQYIIDKVDQDDKFQSIYLKQLNDKVIKTDLMGPYQPKNIVTALAAFNKLKKDDARLGIEHFLIGVKDIKGISGFEGRWQIINKKPRIILECGHNKDGIIEIIDNIKKYECTHIIFGCVDDKDHVAIIEILPKDCNYILCKPNVPRGFDEKQLSDVFKNKGFNNISVCSSVKEAYELANVKCDEKNSILITGSIFVVAECLSLIQEHT